MARKRINRQAICSSDNYIVSRSLHIKMLQENHNTLINIEITHTKIPYVKAWGKLIQISMKDAIKLPESLVVWI